MQAIILACVLIVSLYPAYVIARAADPRVNDIVAKLEVGSQAVCEIVEVDGDSIPCMGDISIVPSASYNAWARNGMISLTSRLVEVSSDDELAFVIAHEFAHVFLGHSGSSIRNELDADRWAAKIMYRSGFDAAAAEGVLDRLQTRRILGFPLSLISHPPNSRRLRTIRMALEEEDAQETGPSKSQSGLASIGLLSGSP